MCLGVPAQVLDVQPDALGTPMGQVSFGGVTREICLAYVPEVEPGTWVLVHAGFAIQQLDEDEARSVFQALDELAQAERELDAETAAGDPGENSSA